jgi:hypothetical protein
MVASDSSDNQGLNIQLDLNMRCGPVEKVGLKMRSKSKNVSKIKNPIP